MPIFPGETFKEIPGEHERVTKLKQFLEKQEYSQFRRKILYDVLTLIEMKENNTSKDEIEKFIVGGVMDYTEYNKQIIRDIIKRHPEYTEFAEIYKNEIKGVQND